LLCIAARALAIAPRLRATSVSEATESRNRRRFKTKPSDKPAIVSVGSRS
jgi:hypothetical protein